MAKQNAVGVPLTLDTGGTGSIAFTAGSVVFSNGSILTQDNASLFWDDTNNRLGIGITTPLDTMHIVGAFELDHTATENDDHALEIVCDAAGFGDVKALDIDYVTGALAATQDEECILINIDETLSTGGEVSALQVLATTEGSVQAIALKCGPNIDAIRQEVGTFGNMDSALNKAVDVLVALSSGGAGNITTFVADNDTFTIGDAASFGALEIILDTGASGAGIAPVWEYSTGIGLWATFSPADGTNGFRNTGVAEWDVTDLAGFATGTGTEFLIRVTRTRNTLSTTPIIDLVQISALTEYKWDKNAALNVASLTLVTDLAVVDGGSGASTLTGVLTGNGTSAITGNAVTQYGTVIAGASNAVSSVAPSATTGIPFISQGASANPAFGTAVVAGGGTGIATTTAYSVICAGTTATGAFQSLAALGAAGTVLTSAGAGALPSFAAPTAATDVSDATFRIQDDGDDTKEIAFEASSITGSTVRTITMPDSDLTLLIPSAVAITGGAIDGTTIGGTTPAAGTFDDLTLDDISGSYADAEQVFKQAGVQTTNTTPTQIAAITVPTNSMVSVEARFNGIINDFSACCSGRLFYTARRVAGGAVEVGTPIIDIIEDSAGAPTVDAAISTNDVSLLVTGVGVETWNWVVTYNYNFTKTNA